MNEVKITGQLADISFNEFKISISVNSTGCYGLSLNAVLDEFLLYGSAISDNKPIAMVDYYRD